MQENAWTAVSNSLDFVDSPTKAKVYFENLKKRHTKKRNDVRKSEKSGTSLAEKEKALNSFKPYEYLSWLDQFIATRASKTNITINDDKLDCSLVRHTDADEFEDDDTLNTSISIVPRKISSKRKASGVEESEIALIKETQNEIKVNRERLDNLKTNPDEIYGQMISSVKEKRF